MGDLSKNLSRHEFACKCGCGFDTVDVGLVYIVQAVRDHFGRPVTINSGCRCPEHNLKVTKNPKSKSQHLIGRAADIVVAGVSPADVADYCETLDPGGIGRYDGFTHVDSRSGAQWRG